jgi:hypothetical protein
MLRPRGTLVQHHPGTVSNAGKGYCSRCAPRRTGYEGKKRHKKPEVDFATVVVRDDLSEQDLLAVKMISRRAQTHDERGRIFSMLGLTEAVTPAMSDLEMQGITVGLTT